MTYFQCDYVEGCHPAILQKLCESNLEQTPGYGADHYCESARQKIRAACGREDLDVHFLVGGTQANTTVLAALLRPHQGALCAESGHIACHETGAIEATGHKVLPLPSRDGTITAAQVDDYCRAHFTSDVSEHMVQPGACYISHPTENGTLYTKTQLEELAAVCRRWGLPLYLDGARLGYGLASPESELDLPDLARLCDVFYIGGTKCGALFGEAVVISDPALKKDFLYFIKQRGGLLAKGRLLGIQFDVLFEGGLYRSICKRAVEQAMAIRKAFLAAGVPLYFDSPTNQQFFVLTPAQGEALGQDFAFESWGELDDGRTAVRFCTSWATRDEDVQALVGAIAAL